MENYMTYAKNHFSPTAIIVFDGYNSNPSTKSETQRRRAINKTSANVFFDSNTVVNIAQSDFLSNGSNKTRLIELLGERFREAGMRVKQASADADSLIVRTAMEEDRAGRPVFVIASDTDILVLLIALAEEDNQIMMLSPGRSTNPGKLFDIEKLQLSLGDIKSCILFTHAITCCDTTSALKGKGKKKSWQAMKENAKLQELAAVFSSSNSSKVVVAAAGEQFLMHIYGGKHEFKDLNEQRMHLYARAIARQPLTKVFDLASLPPTNAAAEQHSYRAYYQVQEWLGHALSPTEWGWKERHGHLEPVPTELPPAPESLLNLISCGCKADCTARCEGRRAGLTCSIMCSHCRGTSCLNNINVDLQSDTEAE